MKNSAKQMEEILKQADAMLREEYKLLAGYKPRERFDLFNERLCGLHFGLVAAQNVVMEDVSIKEHREIGNKIVDLIRNLRELSFQTYMKDRPEFEESSSEVMQDE